MGEAEGELWAVRTMLQGAEIWTENGKFVATFVDCITAEDVVVDHNVAVEMNRPLSSEAIKSHKEKQAERLSQWRKYDPSGARLIDLIISSCTRLSHLLSLKAPNIFIVQSIETIHGRVEALKTLYPPTPNEVE